MFWLQPNVIQTKFEIKITVDLHSTWVFFGHQHALRLIPEQRKHKCDTSEILQTTLISCLTNQVVRNFPAMIHLGSAVWQSHPNSNLNSKSCNIFQSSNTLKLWEQDTYHAVLCAKFKKWMENWIGCHDQTRFSESWMKYLDRFSILQRSVGPGAGAIKGIPCENHLKFKSCKISFVHYICFSCQIVLQFCAEHGSITVQNFKTIWQRRNK